MRIVWRHSILLAGVLALGACQDTRPALEQARAQIAATLPAAYFEDLVTESVTLEGDRLVLLVRSPEGDADRTREQPQFKDLRQSEQDEMESLCVLAAIEPLIATDAVLVRRFVDRHDKPFFEVELRAAECATALMP